MAYQDCDGFDNYNTASLRWSVGGTAPTFSTAYRRFAPPGSTPGQGISIPDGSYIFRPLLSNQATLIGKCAYFPVNTPTNVGAIMGFDSGNNVITELAWLPTGALQLYTDFTSGAQTLQYTTGIINIIAPGSWYGIEWLVTFSSTATGVLQVWVNGLQVVNVSSLITVQGANNYGSRVYLGGASTGTIAYYDDYRVWDNTGSTQNAPVTHDTRLITSLPSGVGAFAQWTPNGAAANWQCVDDNPPTGGTTYVSGATAGLTDAYAMENPSLISNVYAVVARSYVAQTGAGRTVEIGVSSGGVQSYGTSMAPTATYAFTDACIPNDPNTGVPWTAAGANSAQHAKQETA